MGDIMNKIAVIGSGGAGKSTLSRKLGEKLNIPVYHLDTLYWKPGWVETAREQWKEVVDNLVNRDSWIIDGNFSSTMDIRLKNADTIIFLSMPTYLCLYSIFKRRLMYSGRTRPDMNEGCKEKLDLEFVKWVWNYNKKVRPEIIEKLNECSKEKNIIILKNRAQVKKFAQSTK